MIVLPPLNGHKIQLYDCFVHTEYDNFMQFYYITISKKVHL